MLRHYIPSKNITAEQVLDINSLNKALKTYAEDPSKENLTAIISAAENFIRSIPEHIRIKSSDQTWEEILSAWPDAIPIRNIQKKAVELLYLPEAENSAKARWQMLRELFISNSDSGQSKILEEEYWPEFKFRGQMAIANWIRDSSYEALNKFNTFHEAIEADKNRRGLTKLTIKYFKDPSKYEIQLKNGKAYQARDLLDTSDAAGTDIKSGECIFVADTSGKIYCNDPRKFLTSQVHHSSFLQGRPVMAAGTLRVENGVIKEITLLSGHYRPGRKELLDFLKLLQKNSVNLKQISVIDRPNGIKKNAFTYLKTKGVMLGDDRAETINQLASEAFKEILNKQRKGLTISKDELDNAEKLLNIASDLGSPEALYNKAQALVKVSSLYQRMDAEERNKTATKILEHLQTIRSQWSTLAREFLAREVPSSSASASTRTLNNKSKNLPNKMNKIKDDDKHKLISLRIELSTPGLSIKQQKEMTLETLNGLINAKTDIKSLYAIYSLLNTKEGDFLRKEQGFHKIFGTQGQTKRWQNILDKMQHKALDLAKQKGNIDNAEKEKLLEIWRTPKGRIGAANLFETDYKKQFYKLIYEKKIHILELNKEQYTHKK